MPSITSPHTAYWPFRKWPSSNMMKNWLFAECGFCARAALTTPRSNGAFENSAFRSGLSDPAHARAAGGSRPGP